MPVVETSLLPPDTSQETLEDLYWAYWRAFGSVPELGLTRKHPESITFLFPRDLLGLEIGKYFLIRVTELTPKPERSEDVRKKLADALVIALVRHFPGTTFVETIVKLASPDDVIVCHRHTF